MKLALGALIVVFSLQVGVMLGLVFVVLLVGAEHRFARSISELRQDPSHLDSARAVSCAVMGERRSG